MSFYWNEDDRKDQEARRLVNAGRIYTDNARCDWCGAGSVVQCAACESLVCPLHICVDGCCPECTGSGKYAVRED